MKKSFLIYFLLFSVIASCDLPPHYAKKKDLEDSSETKDSSFNECCGEDLFEVPVFDKLDHLMLVKLFHADSIDKKKNAYWIPSLDELLEKHIEPSVCTTSIDDIFYFEDEKNSWAFVLFVTYDFIANEGYHSSAPIIGGATFLKTKDKKWELYNLDKSITRHGEMGELKPYKFLRYGKSDYALQLMFSYTATGETIEQDFFYDLKELSQIFAFQSGDSNEGMHPEGDPDHFSYSTKFTFRPSLKKYYDLVVKMKGTNYDYEKDSKYSVDTTFIYQFNDLRRVYEPVLPSSGVNEQ